MLRDVYLHGALGREFGRHFRIAVETPAEAVRALITLRPQLRQRMRESYWRVIVGPPHIRNHCDFPLMKLGSQPLHLVPATQPRGGDNAVGKIVAGVVLIGASIVTAGIAAGGFAAAGGFGAAMGQTAFLGISYSSIALMGGAMVLGGVASLISRPTPQQTQAQSTDRALVEDRPSFLFNGTVNNTTQGGPVPLVFGTHLVGSIVISAGINAEDV